MFLIYSNKFPNASKTLKKKLRVSNIFREQVGSYQNTPRKCLKKTIFHDFFPRLFLMTLPEPHLQKFEKFCQISDINTWSLY